MHKTHVLDVASANIKVLQGSHPARLVVVVDIRIQMAKRAVKHVPRANTTIQTIKII